MDNSVSKTLSLSEKVKAFFEKVTKKGTFVKNEFLQSKEEANKETSSEMPEGMRLSPDLADHIAGEISDFKDELSPFLPVDLIAGEVPYIPGMESETVWNAASQACATEKVHFVYSVDLENEKIAYLACTSASLASAPDSWCPIVTALPGNPEFIDKETVYVYEQDASVAAMRWHEETGRIQLFIGASRTILPKVQSMDSNFSTISKDTPYVISWKNRQLKTEKLARGMTRTLMLTGTAISLILFTFVFIENVSLFFTKSSIKQEMKETKEASNTLIEESYRAMHSNVIQHNVRVQQLLDELYKIGGTLLKYELSKGKVTWEAYVPQVYLNTKNNAIRGTVVEGEESPDGRIKIRGNK